MFRSLSSFSRFSAFASHLAGSVLIACLCAAMVFGVWYPGAFASASGVASIFLLLVGVDVVLGPLITLIIFNPLKPELRRDLLVVVLVQVLALAFGMYSIFMARPAFAVFNAGRFDLVYANEISEESFSRAPENYSSAPILGPRFVAASLPDDAKRANEIIMQALDGGDDVQNYPEFFYKLESGRSAICAAGISLEQLTQSNPEKSEVIERLFREYASEAGTVKFIPMYAKSSNATIVVDCSLGQVIEVVALRPF